MELLTEQGSILYAPERGTTFMTEARQGLLNTQLDVCGAFAEALEQIAVNLIGDEVATDPPDECFGNATINSIAVSPGLAKIYVTLTSQAGASRSVLIPISLNL